MGTKIASRREHLDAWVHSAAVQNVIMAVILINSITIGAETVVDHGSQAYRILFVLDHLALAVFIVEIAVKLVATGPARFFRRGWNVFDFFDFFVVAIALVPGAGPVSVLRTLRVMRLLRVIKFMPSLRRVVESILLSLPGISAIALLMAMIVYVSAVMSTAMFGQAELLAEIGTYGTSRSVDTALEVSLVPISAMGRVPD
ncbi:MAG: ion transporter [Actinomyces sp.]|uniref:ion transporter n=1 Tax=Actinomyces sp. TaxID=29317 RepID=UPI0026DCF4C3|nr:ion transporter [Actinomyces sp.]MDO4243578.1 ion transporter [Actinomyces sp.]